MLELLILAIAPTLFIFLYIYRKDCYEPEPRHLVAWVFFLGALSVIPAAVLELPFPEGIISSVVVAPAVEETLKFLVVFLSVYRHPEFDEPMDGIVYAMAAGLGFATIENILYVLEGGVAVGIIRAIASVPGHVIFSCTWGFALGMAKFRPAPGRTGIILAGLFSAILLHGVFNFSLEVLEVAGLVLILLIIIPLGWWMTCRNIRSAHASPASACSATVRSRPGTLRPSQPAATPIPPAHPEPPPPPDPAGTTTAENTLHAGAGTRRFCTYCGASNAKETRFCENCGRMF